MFCFRGYAEKRKGISGRASGLLTDGRKESRPHVIDQKVQIRISDLLALQQSTQTVHPPDIPPSTLHDQKVLDQLLLVHLQQPGQFTGPQGGVELHRGFQVGRT